MSSIAYITDKKMIEFHRLNRNQELNFWRPGNSRKMNYFHIGDYLFFLTKGTEKGTEKEKGIVGYGKLKKNSILSFNQMWQQYKTLNGYPTKEALMEAICKITKDHSLPKQLNCLYLTDIVFFQAPIYLSEIGLFISNKIESYFYIDRDRLTNTSKILHMAEQIGYDTWSSIYQVKDENDLIIDAQLNLLSNITDRLSTQLYNKYDGTRITKYISSIFKTDRKILFKMYEFAVIKQDQITVYLPCLVNTFDFMQKVQFTIGHYKLFESFMIMEKIKHINLYLIFNQPIEQELVEILNISKIPYIVDEGED